MFDLFSLYSQVEQATGGVVSQFILQYGGIGVLIGMFLESSVVPIPSEAVFVAAGALGIDLLSITVFGTIGSTLGAMIGYYIGLKGGRPVIDKIGPYLFITNEKVAKAEKFYQKHGGVAVLVSRLVPFIPFKVFSITSGILKLDFKQFIFFTFIGTIPRAFILGWIGAELIKYKEQAYIAIVLFVALIILYFVVKKYMEKGDEKRG